jgi:hypothetical protein
MKKKAAGGLIGETAGDALNNTRDKCYRVQTESQDIERSYTMLFSSFLFYSFPLLYIAKSINKHH